MSSNLLAQKSGFSLSTALVGMSMDYREYDDNDKILDSEMSDFNEMVGGDFSFIYAKNLESKNRAEFGVNMTILSGETEYVGAYLHTGLGYGSLVSTTKNVIFDNSIDYTYFQVFNNGIELSYGLGLGYRSWRRELSPTQIEDYTWYSFRQKFGISYNLKKWSIGANFEYQHGINPQMTILADSVNPDTTVNLRSVGILEYSIPVKFTLNKKIDFFVEYVYQKQTIEKSDTAPYIFNGMQARVYEPRSTAHNQYAKFGAIFKF
ncbi:MAG: hypothetical protein U9O86_03720 [Campylobacterota bacterium]|nr:hypothetical protein [Campylobacterota bacterium]